MNNAAKKKGIEEFSIVYRYFEDLQAALDLAAAKSIASVVIRTAADGGELHWQLKNGFCLTVDLETAFGLESAIAAIQGRIFDAVIFSCDPERDLHDVRMSPGEVGFAQEVMWRRLGAKGRIVAYPSRRGISPSSVATEQIAVPRREELDARMSALTKGIL